MGTKLTYPKLPDGYRWNLLNKINYKIGKWPATATTGSGTHLNFIEDLTAQEIDDVDAIMADENTAQDPIILGPVNSRLIVPDVYDHRATLEANFGYNVAITYRPSGAFEPGVNDEIVLQPTDPTYQAHLLMTNPLRNALENTLIDLWYWE
jgi:hypothetical protein